MPCMVTDRRFFLSQPIEFQVNARYKAKKGNVRKVKLRQGIGIEANSGNLRELKGIKET